MNRVAPQTVTAGVSCEPVNTGEIGRATDLRIPCVSPVGSRQRTAGEGSAYLLGGATDPPGGSTGLCLGVRVQD